MALSPEERACYEWQIWVPGFGEAGQEKLKEATVMVSRCGGLGGVVALELAAAGIGRLIIAHGGEVKPSDLNRQILQTWDAIDQPRIVSIEHRLKALNPRLDLVLEDGNVTEDNAERLVGAADLVVDCAPLFEERYLMNRECVRQGKVMVEAAMFDLQAQVTTIDPGRTPCLRCLYPQAPLAWKREFPVFGAVSATVGSIAAMEAIKVIAEIGEPLYSSMLSFDLRAARFWRAEIERRTDCVACSEC